MHDFIHKMPSIPVGGMKMLSLGLVSASLILASPQAIAQNAEQKDKEMNVSEFDQDNLTQGPSEYFTGKAIIASTFSSGDYDDYKGAVVNFEAGARTNWHTHPKGQTLLILSGEGRAQSEGEPVRKLQPGDTVWFPAGERHWHGAAPNTPMSHVAIQSPDENGEVVNWLEPVADEDYMKDE